MSLLAFAYVVTVVGFELEEGEDSKYIPNAYVVEMDNLSALGRRSDEVHCFLFVGRAKELTLHKSIHDSVYRHMERRGILFDVKNEYNAPDIMVGASMNLKVRSMPSYTTTIIMLNIYFSL